MSAARRGHVKKPGQKQKDGRDQGANVYRQGDFLIDDKRVYRQEALDTGRRLENERERKGKDFHVAVIEIFVKKGRRHNRVGGHGAGPRALWNRPDSDVLRLILI